VPLTLLTCRDEGFTPLTDTELVELVLSDNAPGLVDVLDTDEPTVPTYNLTACLEALELIQITLSANGAFSAEIEDKLADVVDDVSFVQRNTVKARDHAVLLCHRGRHL
jgi:hypothetical protein